MVIINADDFGMNERCSRAIARAFAEGLITDTTIMANGKYFEEALSLAREQGFERRIGIHLNITEGEPLTEAIKNQPGFVSDGSFNKRYDLERELTSAERDALYKEFTAQLRRLENAGIKITHADSHHYVHNAEHIAPIAERACLEHGINKLRLKRNLCAERDFEYNRCLRERGFVTTLYFGKLVDIRNKKIPDNTEILVHPDFDKDGRLVDRRGVENGRAFGEPIPKLTAAFGSYDIL